MFDPTIFDNIKVVLEGNIYEYDFQKEINIINRQDLIDLAIMDRKFFIQYKLVNDSKNNSAEIQLLASTKDLASEILELNTEESGCVLKIKYYISINDLSRCDTIKLSLRKIWGERPSIEQKIIYQYIDNKEGNIDIDNKFLNETTLLFNRKINENNVEDIKEIIAFSIKSLDAFRDI